MYVLDTMGLTKYTLGTVITSGESFVLPVPHGVWFAAISKEDVRNAPVFWQNAPDAVVALFRRRRDGH